MKKVFISRKLKPSSPIRQVKGDYELTAKSLIHFSALDFEAPKADWIFFYSRNGVKYFFKKGSYELFPYQWACLSEGTAEELSHYVTDVAFVGQGTPEQIAVAYKNEIKPGEVTCFVRAENSIDSIRKQLNQSFDFSIPVYRNAPILDIPDEAFDILIFTSPMNADVWFNNSAFKGEKVISIGTTTARHLKNEMGIEQVTVAKNPSELSIAECLQSLLLV